MSADPPSRRSSAAAVWVAGGTLVAAAAALLWTSWRRWPHFLVDFGRELYVPWRLSEGDMLYADLAYFNGPLSPHLNSAAFRLFGPGLTTLVLLNLAILLTVLVLIYMLLVRLGGHLAATIGGLFFLVVFALGDLAGIGNYNFVAPYSHEMTHGTLLSMAVLVALAEHLREPRRGPLEIAGLCLGLIFLTKAEFFLAVGVAVAAALALSARARREGGARFVAEAALVASVACIPSLVVLLLMSVATSPGLALRAVLGTWAHVFSKELARLPFYSRILGIDNLPASLERMGVWMAAMALILGPALLVAALLSPRSRGRRPLALLAVLWVGGSTVYAWLRLGPEDFARPLPLVLLLGAVLLVIGLLRGRKTEEVEARSMALLVLTVFALALLAKIFFAARFHHYGFALALPATLAAVLFLLHAVPEWLDRRGRYGPAFRLAAVAFLGVVLFGLAQISLAMYQRRSLPLGTGRDAFLAAEDAALIQRVLPWLGSHLETDETLAVVPEGVMLNYLLRRRNSTPFISFMPPEVIMFGEAAMVTAFRDHPPDVVIVVKRNTLEYGYPTLGDGYGEELMRWIRQHYGLVETFHDPGLEPRDFARLLVLRAARPEVRPAEDPPLFPESGLEWTDRQSERSAR